MTAPIVATLPTVAARKARLHAFRLLIVGEGIEKKSSDFASDVLSMAKQGG